MIPRKGVFVTGTGTNVGKTIVAACLVQHWTADYWKPIQTGLATDPADTDTVALLAQAAPDRIHLPRLALQAPLSPEAAASLEGVSIEVDDFDLPPGHAPIVVEGAGGVLVPLGGAALMTDLMTRLRLPILLVARDTLGTINHTLLSIEALRTRNLSILGVIMVAEAHQEDDTGNAEAIARLGRVTILGTVPHLDPLTPLAIAKAARRLPAAAPLPQPAPPRAR